jgi:cytoskeletal protein RodZ
MSYESEERYWTDYLRVALPVIGLLLMLALFWWWAQNFIGDENDPEQQANIIQTQVATTSPPTPTATVEITVEATEVENTPDPNETSTTLGDETPEDSESDCGFAKNDRVLVTEDDVNLRPEPSTEGEPLGKLAVDTELIIISDCYTSEGENDFWEVKVRETAEEGWVAAQFLVAEE